ncbi:MAG: heme-copper oxidase subunit III [Acidimicrobiia bacterium]
MTETVLHVADTDHAADGHTDDGHAGGGHRTSTGLSNEKLAMWAFLGSECLLFGGLISVFLINRVKPVVSGPEVHELYDIPFTSVSSFVLLMSSLTMVLALAALKRGEHRQARTWILATATLGASFVAGQVYEFTSFVKEGMGFTTSLQSSSFYTLTGFHGVHVTLGIVMLLSLYVLSLRGKLPTAKSESLEIVGLYWHFVDVVWILIFTVVYLIEP